MDVQRTHDFMGDNAAVHGPADRQPDPDAVNPPALVAPGGGAATQNRQRHRFWPANSGC